MVPINSEEIAILGGSINNTDILNDILIFNKKTEKFTEEANGNPIEFSSGGKGCAYITPNSLVALVYDKQQIPLLIEFKKGTKTKKFNGKP